MAVLSTAADATCSVMTLPQVVASVARSRVQGELHAVEAAAAKATRDLGAGLLLHVYRTHPPTKPSLAISELESLVAAAGAAAAGRVDASAQQALKKALLKAQRDFHPDRNQGREHVPTFESTGALKYGVLEWQMLSNAICQRLTIKFDKMFKTMEAVLE